MTILCIDPKLMDRDRNRVNGASNPARRQCLEQQGFQYKKSPTRRLLRKGAWGVDFKHGKSV